MRQYLGKQPGVVTVSGDDPKRFAAAMVEYTKEKVREMVEVYEGNAKVWGFIEVQGNWGIYRGITKLHGKLQRSKRIAWV